VRHRAGNRRPKAAPIRFGEGAATRVAPSFGEPAAEPLYLVCAHGRRDVCCARFGGPLARALSAAHPLQVWETTHVGGHRYAANLVILPHGLYYGPGPARRISIVIAAAILRDHDNRLTVAARLGRP
jgi:hypothetical protein